MSDDSNELIMTGLSHLILQNNAAIVMTLLICVVMLVCFSIWQAAKLSKLQKRWSGLLTGPTGASLENILYEHLRERMVLQSDFEKLQARTTELENKMTTTKRHLGLIRYDAFEEVGGSQSFALAIFDDRGDGAVLSSLIGRAECRVYCKPLSGGRSERNLSQEEQKAISNATSSSPKAIVSS